MTFQELYSRYLYELYILSLIQNKDKPDNDDDEDDDDDDDNEKSSDDDEESFDEDEEGEDEEVLLIKRKWAVREIKEKIYFFASQIKTGPCNGPILL